MIRKIAYFSLIISVLAAAGCSAASTTNTSSNANTAIAVSNAPDPTQNANIAPPANSAIAGIPNAPANLALKEDPTRNAKIKTMTNPAPDNSEVSVSLGEYPIETRTFKSHPQLAKVERIQDVANKKTIVKVYLKNGQVRELGDGKIQNPMGAAANDILQALTGAASPPTAQPDVKKPTAAPPPPASETQSEQAPADQKKPE
jgi:hypothetical protein